MENMLREKLKAHKIKYKLSDYEIALDSDVSQDTVRRFILNDGKFKPRTVLKISNYLKNYLTAEQKLEAAKLDVQGLIGRNERFENAIKKILAEADQILSNDFIFSRAVSNIKTICNEVLK